MNFIHMVWTKHAIKLCLSNRNNGGQFLKLIFIFLRLRFLYEL